MATRTAQGHITIRRMVSGADGADGAGGVALTCTPITVKKSSSQQTVYSYLTMTAGEEVISPSDISIYVSSTPSNISYVTSADATDYVRLTFTVNADTEPSGTITVQAGYNGSTYTGIISVTTVADGVGIASVTEYYAVSGSNTTAPTSWSTSVPTMTSTNRYLWNYEVVTYTDGTSYTSTPVIIGVYGDTGATGAAGADGITFVYSNNPMMFTTDTSGQVSTAQTCEVTLLVGGEEITPTLSKTGSSGCSTAVVSGNVVTIFPGTRTYATSTTNHTVMYSSGYVDISTTYDGVTYTGRVSFTADTSSIWYQFYATGGLFQSLQSSVDDLDGQVTENTSSIEQTSTEISLTVQENTYGGNLLTGTKFQSDSGLLRSYSDTTVYYSTSYPDEVGAHVYVDPDGGYGSTSVGSLRMVATSSDSMGYIGALWTDVGDLTAGTTYYFSAWVKKNSAVTMGSGFAFQVKDSSNTNVTAYYNGTSTTQLYVSSQVSTYDTWTLVTCTWTCDSDIESAIVRFWLRDYGDVEISRAYFGTDESASWCLSESELVDVNTLLATGIDIQNKLITLTADTVKFQDNSGSEILLLEAGGTLNTGTVVCKDTDENGNEYTNVEIGSREGTTDQGEIRIFDAGVLRVKLNSSGLFFLDPDGYVTGQFASDGSAESVGEIEFAAVSIVNTTEEVAVSTTATLSGAVTYYLYNKKMYTSSALTTKAESGTYYSSSAIPQSRQVSINNTDGSSYTYQVIYYTRKKYTVSSDGSYTITSVQIS